MPKSENQKLKLLYILKVLMELSDEDHLCPTQMIINELDKVDIKADRKTIYKDIEDLRNFGYDIVLIKGKEKHGYFLAARDFELAELKVLVDAVQASRFITLKKSQELIAKITKLAGAREALQLKRQIYVLNRIKADNESIYYNVDEIHKAIQNNKEISFEYYEYNIEKKLCIKNEGERYIVSPWALIWNEENYYLISYDTRNNMIKHFRVDKMKSISETGQERILGEKYQNFDTATYANKMFGMFGGETEMVKLRFASSLIGVVLDRFGKETKIRNNDEESFMIRVNISVSNQFFGWISGFGSNAEIVAPEEVREEYLNYLGKLTKLYKQQ